jgi:hypothetical protein
MKQSLSWTGGQAAWQPVSPGRGGPMARDRRQVLHQSSPVRQPQPASPAAQQLHPLPDIRLCYNSPDTPALSQIQGSPPSSDMLVPWLTSWSWSPSLFGGGDSRLRDGDHGWDAWMAAECSSHPCIHAAIQPRNPCHAPVIHLITTPLFLHVPRLCSHPSCHVVQSRLRRRSAPITSINATRLPSTSSFPLPYNRYDTCTDTILFLAPTSCCSHRLTPDSPSAHSTPIHPFTHAHPLSTPSSCSSPSSPPC